MRLYFVWWFDRVGWKLYQGILLPILACEFLWSLGENVYAAIYGNLGTKACAAMTLTIPVQTLVMGAMSGLGQAAGIITGIRRSKEIHMGRTGRCGSTCGTFAGCAKLLRRDL